MARIALLAGIAALALGAPAEAEWLEASSKHFVVYSDDTSPNIKDYATRLERFDRAIRVLHNDASRDRGAASKVIVFVLPGTADIQRLRPNAAGFWQPRTVPVAFMPRSAGGEATSYGFTPQVIMFHEYTHHWMLTSWSDAAIPAWYAEGAAELHATAMFRPDGGVLFGAVPRYRSYGVTLRNQMPVSKLLRAGAGKLDRDESAALYGRGWLLTHYLTFDDGRRKVLSDYVGAINNGRTPDQAALILGDVSSLDLKLDGYAQRPKLPTILIPAAQLPTGEIVVRKLGAGEAATMPARIRSTAGVDRETAPQVLSMARKAAASFPNDPAAQSELAEAEYDAASLGPKAEEAAGYARAGAAADRAIAADPKSVHALIYKGMAKEALAIAAAKTDAATWSEVRRWYIQANRADTESAEPLIRYYASFAAAEQKPTASAEKGLLYAYALAPHDGETRFMAAKVLLGQGRAKEARTAIGPLAYSAEAGAAGTAYRAILDAIDSQGASAAMAKLKEFETTLEVRRKEAEKKRA